MIINLISSPRNVSTAVMYSFAHRGDVRVVDEPFYGYYLNLTNADHPGKDEIIRSQPLTVDAVLENIGQIAIEGQTVFVKNMAHHLIETDLDFLLGWANVFLIRNPRQLIASFAQVVPEPSHRDIGIRRQYELFRFLQEKGRPVLVIDSGELLQDPFVVLSSLCEKLGLPMTPDMLRWKAGSLPEDGIWAKHWYANVHRSTGFEKQPSSERELPPHCQQLYEEALPYYNELSRFVIKAR